MNPLFVGGMHNVSAHLEELESIIISSDGKDGKSHLNSFINCIFIQDSLDSMLGGKTQPDPKDDSLKTEEEDSPMCVRTPRMKHQVFASKHKNGGYVTR